MAICLYMVMHYVQETFAMKASINKILVWAGYSLSTALAVFLLIVGIIQENLFYTIFSILACICNIWLLIKQYKRHV